MAKRPPSLALIVAVLCFGVACNRERAPLAPASPIGPEAPPRPWPRFAEVERWTPVNDVAFPSRGHLVTPNHATVRVSDEARAAYLGIVQDSVMPVGTLILMFHQSADRAQRGPVYVMEKQPDGWSFTALDGEGRPAAGDPARCATCHEGGVADSLFGLPRSLTVPASQGSVAPAPVVELDAGRER